MHAITDACGPWLSDDELAHRDEHSIEFQAVELAHVYGARPFTIVPLLCGGFHGFVRYERRPTEESASRRSPPPWPPRWRRSRRRGDARCSSAGVDLSHVGARFGDAVDLDAATLSDIEAKDRAAIAAALTGSSRGVVRRGGRARRLDAHLRVRANVHAPARGGAPGPGRLLAYEQSLEEGGSVVTYASLAWPAGA